MKRTLLLLVLAAASAGLLAGCGDKNPLKPPPPPKPAEKPRPAAAIQVQNVTPQEELALKDYLRVDGVLRQGTTYTASINAQVVNVGEYITLSVKGRSYLLNVLMIGDEVVRLRAVEQMPVQATTKKM